MQARVVGAAEGARWVLRGWRMFRAAPVGWVAIVMAYLLVILIASAIPGVGIAVIALATPAFSVSFMAVARSASTAGSVQLPQLFEGFRQGLRTQLLLGAVYFACIVAAIGLTALATGTRPGAEAEGSEPGAEAAGVFALFFLLYLPTVMAFWFAPVLAAWHSIGTAKALFFSFFACLMNWRAFLAYGVVLAGVIFALSAAAVLTARLFLPGMDATKLALPMLIVVYPTVLASYYASYRDVFAETP
jgi:hypothetical protein